MFRLPPSGPVTDSRDRDLLAFRPLAPLLLRVLAMTVLESAAAYELPNTALPDSVLQLGTFPRQCRTG